MHNVFYVVPCADITCIGYFFINAVMKNELEWNPSDFNNKEINQELDFWSLDHSQHCFRFMLYFKVYNHNSHSIFLK